MGLFLYCKDTNKRARNETFLSQKKREIVAHQQVAALVQDDMQDDSRKHCSKGQTYKPCSQMCESVWDKWGGNTEEKEKRANCGGFWANL